MTSCSGSRATARSEVSHDTVREIRTVTAHDTVRVTRTVTIVLNEDSTERSRTTEESREHLRSTAATAEERNVAERTRSEETRTAAGQREGGAMRPFLAGTLAGTVLTTAAIVLARLRKKWKSHGTDDSRD